MTTPPPSAAAHHDRTVGGVRPKLLLKGMVLILSLALMGWGLKASGLADALNEHWIDSQIRGHGLNGELIYLAIGTVAIAIGFPRQAVCFLGGYAFGLLNGILLSSLASLAGCVFCFFYARLLGRDLVMHKFAARVAKVDAFLRGNPITMAILIRFLPVGSNLLTNLVAGVSSVRPMPFFVGSLIGYVPQTLVFVLLGTGINVDPMLRVSLSAALFIASAFLGVFLYRRLRHGHSLDSDLDKDLDAEGENS